MILGTEFTDNKSPNDPFPPEWGKFHLNFVFKVDLLYGIFGVCGVKFVRLMLHNYMANLIEPLCAFCVFDIKTPVSFFVNLKPVFKKEREENR